MTRTMKNGHPFVPYEAPGLGPEHGLLRGVETLERMEARRSVRDFVDTPVSRRMIEIAIQAASTAPSGAHMQPWTFVAISDPTMKSKIRAAAEAEERKSYAGRMSEEWRRALEPLGTDHDKPYLDIVPWIVVLFAQRWGVDADGRRTKHYYVQESCGIAAGMFISALHEMGLCTLTHTPSPMGFLSELLQRPDNEKPFILFPVGYATPDALVPDITRKPLSDVAVWFDATSTE